MMRRTRLLWIGLIPIILTVTAFLALASAEPAAGPAALPTPEPSTCIPALSKSVDPVSILLGEYTKATLIVSGTCAAKLLPIDLVILADDSNSMGVRQGQPGLPPTEPPETPPDPRTPPTPPAPPTPGEGPGLRGEPPFCSGMGDIPTTIPTGTATRRPPPWRTPSPVPPPPEVTPDIEPLEPSGEQDQIREVKKFVTEFMRDERIVKDMADGRLKVGFVSFNEKPKVKQSLTNLPSRVTTAAGRMNGDFVTRIDQGIREAQRNLAGSGSRVGAAKVVLILSDFQFCARDMTKAKLDRGTDVVAIGFGVRDYDRSKLNQMATDPRYVFERAKLSELLKVYDESLAGLRPVTVEDLTVQDELADDMRLIPGSVDPPTVTITGQLLEWQFAQPVYPLTLSYVIEPLATGTVTVSKQAGVAFTDSEGLQGAGPFPDVVVDVKAYTPTPTSTSTSTPTPTPTPTSTPTATPKPLVRYLPILFRNWPEVVPTAVPTKCIPSEQTLDVALVIDTSTSMSDPTQAGGQPKLTAAIEAAQELVTLLKAEDQAAVIGFNSTATLVAPLTTDKAQLSAALQSLPATQSPGTAINLGLQAALDELTGPRHRPDYKRSIVAVTDGRQTDPIGVQAVRNVAQAIREAGIVLITVGLGTDIDEQLLREIAYIPTFYFAVPKAEDLLVIYRQMVDYIACP